MQRKSHQHKATTQPGLTIAEIDALISAYEIRRTNLEYRHEQREELSAAKRDLEHPAALQAAVVKAGLHTARIGAYAQAFATVTESLSVLIKSLTPGRAAAYAAALITLLDAISHLWK